MQYHVFLTVAVVQYPHRVCTVSFDLKKGANRMLSSGSYTIQFFERPHNYTAQYKNDLRFVMYAMQMYI